MGHFLDYRGMHRCLNHYRGLPTRKTKERLTSENRALIEVDRFRIRL